jgi:hypothetical protein
MFVMIKSIGFADHVPAAEIAELRAAIEAAGAIPGVIGSALMETAPRTSNGGTFLWRATFADEGAYHNCTGGEEWRRAITPLLGPEKGVRIDGAAYAPRWQGTASPGLRDGVWRVLLVACEDGSTRAEREAMERDHLLMPRHVPAIRNWAYGRVVEATGRRRWSHVWEQEYDDVDGLLGPYLHHPVHWGLVDRWYDLECPERIVDPHVVSAFAAIPQSIMSAGVGTP